MQQQQQQQQQQPQNPGGQPAVAATGVQPAAVRPAVVPPAATTARAVTVQPNSPVAATAGRTPVKVVNANGQVVRTVPAGTLGRGVTRYVTLNRNGSQPTYRIVARGRGTGRTVLVPQQGGRVSVLQNYQQQMQAIRIPPGFTVRKTPDGRIFLCPSKTAAKQLSVNGSGTLIGDAKTLAAELVPYPENKDDKAELKKWDKAWTEALKAKSKESDLTTNMMLAHLRRILNMERHPLYDTFSKALSESKEKASAVAASDDNSADRFLDVVQSTVEILYAAIMKHYNVLREEPFDSWAQNGLYEITFQNLYNTIFSTYTSRFKKDDDEFLATCKKFSNITPAHLGLPKRFWLTDAQTVPEDTPLTQVPYGSAISALREMDKMHSHMSKVVAFVESAHRIYTSVEKYWEGKPDKPSKLEIAADEFLPLFSYVIIRSCLATVSSSMAFINDFMTEQECSGEAGYYFATFQSAFAYVQTLTEKDVEDAYKDAWGIPRPDKEEKNATATTPAAGDAIGDEFVNGTEEFADWTAEEEALPDFSEPVPEHAALPPDVPVPEVPDASLTNPQLMTPLGTQQVQFNPNMMPQQQTAFTTASMPPSLSGK